MTTHQPGDIFLPNENGRLKFLFPQEERLEKSMPSDIALDEDGDGWITVGGFVLKARTSDLMLDSPHRRGPGGGPHRRALVHNQIDGLTINFNGDYPGGVSIVDAQVALRVHIQEGGSPQLPKAANIGDLRLLRIITKIQGKIIKDTCSLWLCVGLQRFFPSQAAEWREVPLGETVTGTV